jgi:hypothetical protein
VARRLLPLLVLVLAGCGTGASAPRPRIGPQYYTPSAHHATRVPGTIYPDEIGENIVGLHTPYKRLVQLFGAPAARRGSCVYYHLAGHSRGWQFCLTKGRVTSADGFVRVP